MSPMTSKNVQNVAENGTKVNYFQSPRFLFIIGHWSMNQTYYCETRFWDSHDVLCWQVMDSPGMFTNNIGYKVLSGSSLTGSDKVRLSLLTLTLDSDHNPPFSHQYPISASEQLILRAWTWDPCIYFYKISTAWNSQNSCIVCWRFCLRLVIEEILWMEVSGV